MTHIDLRPTAGRRHAISTGSSSKDGTEVAVALRHLAVTLECVAATLRADRPGTSERPVTELRRAKAGIMAEPVEQQQHDSSSIIAAVDVEYAFLADSADAPPNGKLYVLGAGIDRITAANFPVVQPTITLVVKLRLHAAECGAPHTFTADLWDNDGQPCGVHIEQQFIAARNSERPAASVYAQLIMHLVGLRFSAPGDYSFELMVDGTHYKSISLALIQLPNPGPSPAQRPQE